MSSNPIKEKLSSRLLSSNMVQEILPDILPGAEPINIDQGNTVLMFIHGYTSSAFEGKFFSEYFAPLGYGIRVPLLPGHGTHPDDLGDIHYRDWLAAVENEYKKCRADYQRVVVCGQSLGGALAMHLAANYPLDAVITLAGAFFLRDWRLRLLPLARYLIRYQYKSKGPDIRDSAIKKTIASYPKYPVSSIDQVLQLLSHVRPLLPAVNCPALLVHSRKDHTVVFDNLDYAYRSIASVVKEKLVLEKAYHVISVDIEKELIFKTIEAFLKKNLAKAI